MLCLLPPLPPRNILLYMLVNFSTFASSQQAKISIFASQITSRMPVYSTSVEAQQTLHACVNVNCEPVVQ
jgi:hypothetical protein